MLTETADAAGASAQRTQTSQTPQQRVVAGLARLDGEARLLDRLVSTVAGTSLGVSSALGALLGGDPAQQLDPEDPAQVAALRGLLTTQARRYEALASLFDQGLTNVLNDLEVVWARCDLLDGLDGEPPPLPWITEPNVPLVAAEGGQE